MKMKTPVSVIRNLSAKSKAIIRRAKSIDFVRDGPFSVKIQQVMEDLSSTINEIAASGDTVEKLDEAGVLLDAMRKIYLNQVEKFGTEVMELAENLKEDEKVKTPASE